MENRKYLNALNLIQGVGPQKIKRLLSRFETARNIWEAGKNELLSGGISEKLAEKIFFERQKIDPQEEWEKIEKEKIDVITFPEKKYPPLLKEIANPPFILYIKGSGKISSIAPTVSIVGSRKFTPYGRQIAFSFAKELASAGITIVSGMAIGIDTFAHQGALAAYQTTIAVLGNGLDEKSIYPKTNSGLAREICEKGLLLSEYPVGTKAGPLTFPARNRLVAGLSMATLVVEAGEKSGALITAQMALDENREVFSVPGSVFSEQSRGTNRLLSQGAQLAASAGDILNQMEFSEERHPEKKPVKIPGNEKEKVILEKLSSSPIHIDSLSKATKINTAELSSTLSIMEIKGWAKNIGGQNYILL